MRITNNMLNESYYTAGYNNTVKKTDCEKAGAGYLQEKYHYMNTGTKSMQGIPTTVSVSGAFLQKCTSDPERAKYLEENLAAIPDCVKIAVNGCQGTLTNLSYQIDANGNISVAISGTSDPDGKIARENAERKAKETKEAEEKAEKRRSEQKAKDEKLAQQRTEKQYNLKINVKDVSELTGKLSELLGASAYAGLTEGAYSTFDSKA